MSPQKAKKLLSVHGKTFNWASYFLTPTSRTKAVALYAFCRRLDDLVDCAEDIDHESLKSIRLGLNNANLEIDHPILDDAVELIENHGIPLAPILDLLDGMISDCNDVFIPSEKELIEYSYKVAGSVGLMMTPILGCRNPDAFRHAIDLGIAMQLTNIGRDVLEDAQRGRRYLPGDWCDFKSPETIVRAASDRTETETREKVSDAIRKIVLIAEKYYESGMVVFNTYPRSKLFRDPCSWNDLSSNRDKTYRGWDALVGRTNGDIQPPQSHPHLSGATEIDTSGTTVASTRRGTTQIHSEIFPTSRCQSTLGGIPQGLSALV